LLAVCKHVMCLSWACFYLTAFERQVPLQMDPAYLDLSMFSQLTDFTNARSLNF